MTGGNPLGQSWSEHGLVATTLTSSATRGSFATWPSSSYPRFRLLQYKRYWMLRNLWAQVVFARRGCWWTVRCWCSISSVFMWKVHYQHSSVHRIFMITITSCSCPCVFVWNCCDFIATSWDSSIATDCSRRLPWVTPVTCAFYKRLHFILQDRVHHHVTGCCHPGNVSLMDFHLRIKAWCQPAKVRPQPHEMHDRRLKSVCIY